VAELNEQGGPTVGEAKGGAAAAPPKGSAPQGFEALQALQASAILEFAEIARLAGERKPCVIKLREPLQAGTLTITELTVRRPTVRELRTSSFKWGGEKSYAELLTFGARLCGHDVAVLDGLDVEDANRLVLATSFFCGLGLPPGTSS